MDEVRRSIGYLFLRTVNSHLLALTRSAVAILELDIAGATMVDGSVKHALT